MALIGIATVPWSAHAGEKNGSEGARHASNEHGDEADDPDDPIVVAPIDVRARGRDEIDPDGLTGADPRSPDAERGLDEPAFVTLVRVDDRAGETTSVAEVLGKTMGVQMRSLGGLGSYSALSVRGADSGHTTVLVDGVPLSRVASVSVDLGQFALESFSMLELYRGGVPVEMGGESLGGALNLVTAVGRPASGKPLTLSIGGGSFGTRHLRARWRDGHEERLACHAAVGYTGTEGDYVYYNDNGTNLDSGDDEYVTRTNNGYDRLDGLTRCRARRGELELSGGGRAAWKSQGIPGSASVQSRATALDTLWALFDASARVRRFLGSPRLMGTAMMFGSFERQRYQDPDSEVGVGAQDRRYRTVSAGMTGSVSADAGARQLLAAGLELRGDSFVERDALRTSDTLRSYGWRLGGALTLSDEISLGALDRIIVSPALRLDWMHTVPAAEANDPQVPDEALAPRNDFHASPRLSYRARMTDSLVIKGSAGRYFRSPTVVELFGDRGFIAGNPLLQPETGISGDLGVVLAPPRAIGAVDRVYAEGAFFGRQAHDAIAFRPSAGQATFFNVGDAWIYGLETGTSLRVARTLTLSGNYTWLETRQDSPVPSYDGKPLPQRPRHELYGRIDVARRLFGRLASVWVDYTFVAGNFLDRAGIDPVPARHLLGAGSKIELVPGLLLGIDGKNLTNERVELVALDPPPAPDLTRVPRAVADFLGYPLPGRAVYVSLEWSR